MARVFSRELAAVAASDLMEWLGSVWTRVEVVGSIRRQAERVHDLDLLVVAPQGELLAELVRLSFRELVHLRSHDSTVMRIVHCSTGVPVDLYHAPNLDGWYPRMVALTGGRETLRALREGARRKGWLLGEDGTVETMLGGSGRDGQQQRRFSSELGVFRAAGVRYAPPEQRR